MVTKICPICDQKLQGMNYCPTCKKWIQKPNYISVDYYLNERHPQDWHDCEYHHGGEKTVSASSERTQAERDIRTLREEAAKRAESRKKEKAGKKDQSSKKKASSGKGCLPWLVIGFVFLQVGIPLLFSAADKIGDVMDEVFFTKTPEAALPQEEDLTELSQTELTDSQVMELGRECDAGHMELQNEDVLETLWEALSEHYNLVENRWNSANLVDHSEYGDYHWFQTNVQMDFESMEDLERRITLDVYSDTFSGRVHEIGFHADEEDVQLVMETVVDVLADHGVLAEKPESADSWDVFLENARTSMEEDYLRVEEPALEASEIGMSFYYSEYDGKRRYYVDIWSEEE